MKVIQASVNTPCNGQCYRQRTGPSLQAKWRNKTKQLSFSSHSLLVLCLCCSVVAVICCLLIVLMQDYAATSSPACRRQKGASFCKKSRLGRPLFSLGARLSKRFGGRMHKGGRALRSRASDAVKTGFNGREVPIGCGSNLSSSCGATKKGVRRRFQKRQASSAKKWNVLRLKRQICIVFESS